MRLGSLILAVIIFFAIGIFLIRQIQLYKATLRDTVPTAQKSAVITPTTSTAAIQTEHSKFFERLPADEKIFAFKRLGDELAFVITSPGLTPEDKMGNTYARANEWIVAYGVKPKLIRQHKFEGIDIQNISFKHSRDSGNYYLEVQYDIGGDGPYGWSEFVHELIDLGREKFIASTSWVDNFSPVWSLTIEDQTYQFQLKEKNGCSKTQKDLATGILINEKELTFVKPFIVGCPIFGEGDPTFTPPGTSAPYFHDGRVISFDPLNGVQIDIELNRDEYGLGVGKDSQGNWKSQATMRSKNFTQEFQLPLTTSTLRQ